MKPTQEQALDWAFECDFVESTPAEDVFSSIYVCCPKDIERLVTLAYETGRKDENEACAAQVGQQWVAFEELKAAHYRHSPEPFDPFRFHRDLSTIFFSRDMADAIRARREQ